jgi:hypothetical protein
MVRDVMRNHWFRLTLGSILMKCRRIAPERLYHESRRPPSAFRLATVTGSI